MESSSPARFGAQFGEDRLLAEHFADRLDAGFYVEVGAYDGVEGSATAYFDEIGWRGVLVEAVPELADRCRAARPRARTFNCAAVGAGAPTEVEFEIVEGSPGVSSLSSLAVRRDEMRAVEHIGDQVRIRRVTVAAKTLDEILEEAAAAEIQFVTIDANGHEWEVLQGFTLSRWRPEIVIAERLAHLPQREVMRHMHANGYALRRRTGVNDWFVRCGEASARDWRYRARLLMRHYLPRYLTLYMPLLRGPVRSTLKRALTRLGLLERARALTRRRR